jgi:hypothetical protein
MNGLWIALFLIFLHPSTDVLSQTNLPEINHMILMYVDKVMGTTVGRGECWDLADQALAYAGAKFDKTSRKTIYIFGDRYDPDHEGIMPGDIIQFEDVSVSYREGNMIYKESYTHHTAIVFKVNKDHSLELAHQNTSFGGKKVALSTLRLEDVKKGRMYFYHPVSE